MNKSNPAPSEPATEGLRQEISYALYGYTYYKDLIPSEQRQVDDIMQLIATRQAGLREKVDKLHMTEATSDYDVGYNQAIRHVLALFDAEAGK